VDRYVAISQHVASRIRRYYNRDASVIYPPVDTTFYSPDGAESDAFFLIVSALVPYKRIELALGAVARLGRRLIVVGTGPELARLQSVAGATVEFVGWRRDEDVAALYRGCRAVLFPGVEDFGIVPLEAMASGRPVIALGAGGTLETVVPLDGEDTAPTGVLFAEQTVDALVAAMRRLEEAADRFEPKALRAHAEAFDRPRFKARIADYLDARLAERAAITC
jgi:glycosyltransferase involved in cell wall biosynthesis